VFFSKPKIFKSYEKFKNFYSFVIKLQVLVAFFCLFELSACKNEVAEVGRELVEKENISNARKEEKSTPDIQVKNVRLVFKTWEDFVSTWQSLNQLNLEEVEAWDKKLNFYSLRRFNQDTTKTPRFKEYKFSNGYEAVINPDGEVQIDNIICIFKDGHKYFMLDEHESVLSKLKNNQLQEEEANLKGVVKVKFPIPTGLTEKSTPNGRIEGSAILQGNQFREMYWEYATDITYRITFGLINRIDLQPYFKNGIIVGWDSYLETYMNLAYWRRNWGTWHLVSAGENRNLWIRDLNISTTPPTATGTVVSPPTNYGNNWYRNQDLSITLGSAKNFGICGVNSSCPIWNITNYSGDYEMRVYPHYNTVSPHLSNKSKGLYREPAFFQ
jgi:hypothetical protein